MTEKKTYAHIDVGPLTPMFRFKVVIILTNWLFQGLLYADKTERFFKMCLDLGATATIFIMLPSFNIIPRFLIAFFVSHTLNWTFNGQIFALAKNFDIVNNNPQKIIDYANEIKERASREKSIDCVLVYGSLVRGEIKSTSDLDMRVIRRPGFTNGIRACIFGLMERRRALFNKFPLDFYVIDGTEHLIKMRSDEKPLILLNKSVKYDFEGSSN